MNYIIYGANRVAKDFLYIFDKLKIMYVTDDGHSAEEFQGYEVKTLDEALSDKSYDKIILCDFDKSQKKAKLQECGLERGKDYLYEEDFFAGLDEFHIPPERKLAVWGTGQIADFFTKWNQCYEVAVYFDNHKSAETFYGNPVIHPEQVNDWKEYFIVIAVTKDEDIRAQLQALGLRQGEDFVGYQKIIGLPSHMLRQTIFDQACYDLDCRTMLNHLEIFHDGDTRCCCTTFVRQNLDNMMEKSVSGLWNSAKHRIMCLSTENRTYSFCDKTMCPLFVEKKETKGNGHGLDRPYRTMTPAPEVLALGHDASCNLACVTCRREVCFAKGEEREKVNRVTDKIRKDYLPACSFLILAGDGEVFASPAYREIYESLDCNPRYIRLLSNGMLFTPVNWERFKKNKTGRIMLTVSIDAASKQTYERIRRNGNFDTLKQNMEFAADLRKKGELRYFRMNFVVQRDNYQEMVPFVQWGEALGVDEVFFTKILNWGTYTAEEFAQISMMEPDGTTPKVELREVLEHPVMKSPIVDLGTIQYAHKADRIDMVENYYMWELEKRGGNLFT
nr:radical SAM protein [uncultured Acetatifactor sp.]